SLKVHQGSVNDMPFDQEVYDGIFCYALIPLLPPAERAQLIQSCYKQLSPGGYMVFIAISKKTPAFGKGQEIAKDTFLTPHGVTIFYYDGDSIKAEFADFGLISSKEIAENTQQFWQIQCQK